MPTLGHVVQSVISSIDEDTRKPAGLAILAGSHLQTVEEGVDKLRALFPDTTLLAALDLVDRESGVCLSVRLTVRSHRCSAQIHDAMGEMPLQSPRVHRDVQCLPPSGLVAARVLLLHLPRFRIRSPHGRIASDGKCSCLVGTSFARASLPV